MVEIYIQQKTCIKWSVVIVFQKYFLLGNALFFLFFKNNFDISASKWYENIKKKLIWSKEKNKKKLNFKKMLLT